MSNELLRPPTMPSPDPIKKEPEEPQRPEERRPGPRPAEEVDLLGALSKSLDTFLVAHPPPEPKKKPPKDKKKSRRKKEKFTTSRKATRNFLATKTLVRSIAKACARENVAAGSNDEGGDQGEAKEKGKGDEGEGKEKGEGDEGEGEGAGGDMVELIFDAFKEKYPSLTKEMLMEGMARHGAPSADSDPREEDSNDDDGEDGKLERIVAAVDAEMEKYHERIEALRRSREEAAANPPPEEKVDPDRKRGRPFKAEYPDGKPKAKRIRRRRPEGYPCTLCGKVFTSESGLKYHMDKKVCTEPRKPSPRPVKNTPENFLMNEILKKYAEVRQVNTRPHVDQFEVMVNEIKREHGMEHIETPDMSKLQKKISSKWRKSEKKLASEAEAEPRPASRTKLMVEEIYARYVHIKFEHGDKLPFGTLGGIIDDVKAAHGVEDIPVLHLKVRIQNRFRKEHPEFEETNNTTPGQLRVTSLSEEARQRRQQLLNEIAVQYVRLKERREASGAKKLEDGTLDRVIEEAKDALGIHEFEVNKSSIWGRIHRNSLVVNTAGRGEPVPTHDRAIDEPLVSTVNEWLNQGITVAPEQGLMLANMLLKGKNLGQDENGNEIILDEKWWRRFLKRNGRRLNCLVE